MSIGLVKGEVGQPNGTGVAVISERDALLLSLADLVSTEVSADVFLRRVVDVVAELLSADRCTLYVLDEERGELVSIAAHLTEIPTIRVPVSQGVAGYVARTGELLNIPDCASDSRFWNRVDEKTGYQTRCMLTAPVRAPAGPTLGVLQLLNKHNGTFTARDERHLTLLAGQLAGLLAETTISSGLRLNRLPLTAQVDDDEELTGLDLGDRFNRIVGEGGPMRRVFRSIRRVAPTDATVLLVGEPGTGKNRVASALHHNSLRASGPFVTVDCTRRPEGLLEIELFGHAGGPRPGAPSMRRGQIEAAVGGTLYLAEVAGLPGTLQDKLVGLLSERTFRPVGGGDSLVSDIRIVASSSRNLLDLVGQGRFRHDLYDLLHVVRLDVPALRERGARDLRLLVDHFLAEACRRSGRSAPRIAADSMRRLVSYRWPGNVQELEHCIGLIAMVTSDCVTRDMLPLPQAQPSGGQVIDIADSGTAHRRTDVFSLEPSLADMEARYISHLLRRYDGNRTRCAKILGIGRNTLIRKIRQYGLQ